MELTAGEVASWSKDRSRRLAAVIVGEGQTPISFGYNGFPRGADDTVEERHERPLKYLWTEHAERNAVYNAARLGHRTSGCRMYLPWFPCADCARAIVQAGIVEVICIEPDWEDATWGANMRVSLEMLRECGVSVRFLSGYEALRPVAAI
jgi:dCMP deaminase